MKNNITITLTLERFEELQEMLSRLQDKLEYEAAAFRFHKNHHKEAQAQNDAIKCGEMADALTVARLRSKLLMTEADEAADLH